MPKIKNQNAKIKIIYQNPKILNFGLSFCILIFGFWISCLAQDKIIAIVNNDIITQKDLNDFINFMRIELSQEFQGRELESKIQAMKLDLLDKLIEDSLILQEAKKNNSQIEIRPKVWISIAPDESRVKARINEIKKRYASDMEFQQALSKQGLTLADIESKIREQLLMYNLIDFKIRKKITINPGEVTDFYQQNIQDFKTAEERELEAINIEEQNKAQEIYQHLKKGEQSLDLSQKYSLNINKLTVAKNGQLRKDLEEAVFKLKVGEVSEPVKVEDNFYIFKLNNIMPPRQQSLTEVQDSIYNFLFDKKMGEELTKWLEELKRHAFIQILSS